MKKVVIIGGGASGLVAAIYAARKGDDVTILERNNSVGKKILMTGNGKCNYFNKDQSLDHYDSFDKAHVIEIINGSNLKEVLKLFDSLGIVPKIKNGYYYPNSMQAVSIKEVLLLECKLLNVKIRINTLVNKIIKKDKFIINPDEDKIEADKVIIATGSKAAPKTGSDGIGYELARSLGHKVIPPLPALVQLIGNEKYFKEWNGIRSDAKVTLLVGGKKVKAEKGEIQLTNYGISGICVFNISGICSKGLALKR